MTNPVDPNEYTVVEQPLVAQLVAQGWTHLDARGGSPQTTGRETWRDVLLKHRLREALRRINPDADGNPWLDDARIDDALGELERLGTHKLMEANRRATELLRDGTTVDAPDDDPGGRDRLVRYIDYEHPERNDWLAVTQLRVDPPGTLGAEGYVIPDAVLFVNGIPLVVIECKSPSLTEPMSAAIDQLLRYSNQRGAAVTEGVERLFHYAQVLVATSFSHARAGTVGSRPEHYLEWKTTAPRDEKDVAQALGRPSLWPQQRLVAGLLDRANLLAITRTFTLFMEDGAGRAVKVLARYQQFRAVLQALMRLRHGDPKAPPGVDPRSGVIWHTQGSGKSLTMVFLVRAMRTAPDLRAYKIVVVTDRRDLEGQLSDTAQLTHENVRVIERRDALDALKAKGPGFYFAMIQKMIDDPEEGEVVAYTLPSKAPAKGVADGGAKPKVLRQKLSDTPFPLLDDAREVLVLVDEAHRSHGSTLHRRLKEALPNAAMIAFTGTPIPVRPPPEEKPGTATGPKTPRHSTIGTFGDFIDRYTLKESEQDGATVRIFYEGRTTEGAVDDPEGRSLDGLFEDLCREYTQEQREALKKKYATRGHVLEAEKLIAAKAADMVRHYVANILPNGFKAQVVASSRLACVRYQKALTDALRALVRRAEALPAEARAATGDALDALDAETRFLVNAARHRDTLERLEVAAVISGSQNQDAALDPWSDEARSEARIARFKRPLVHPDPTKADGLAFLCVKNMLLTGFDAPLEQVLYVDRIMAGHELLQAIARVNRTAPGKTCGFVVDYIGIGQHLADALAEYSEDVQKEAWTKVDALVPELGARAQKVMDFFAGHGVPDPTDIQAAVDVLADLKHRAEFVALARSFLELFEALRNRPEAQPHARTAKLVGFIAKVAANLYRDGALDLPGIGGKVRALIDAYIVAKGIDPKVPPVALTDADFQKRVDARPTPRERATEMTYALRHQIEQRFQDDPARYRSLRERLEKVLADFRDNWEAVAQALSPLVKEEQAAAKVVATDPEEALRNAFLGVLLEEAERERPLDPERRASLSALVGDVLARIRDAVKQVNFWKRPTERDALLASLAILFDERAAFEYDNQEPVASLLVQLAERHQSQLGGS